MKKLPILLLFIAPALRVQATWDEARLAATRQQLERPAYAPAYQKLMAEADSLLHQPHQSVTQKAKAAPSGSRHDYVSLARYFWPNLQTPDGLPYVNRDGESNPELNQFDRPRLSAMTNRVVTFTLAWYFSGDERYARAAASQLRAWFTNKSTRMTPHFRYAQHIPGVADGRCYGVLDGYSFIEMLDAVHLLGQSSAWTARDQRTLQAWFAQLLAWLTTDPMALEEGQQQNNHAVAYDVQVAAYARFVGDAPRFEQARHDFYAHLRQQIQPDGQQPHELTRTLAFGYSEYNLAHALDMLQMLGQPDALVEAGLDFLSPYLYKDNAAWPYQQIGQWDEKRAELRKDLHRAALLNPARGVQRHPCAWTDRFMLLYVDADATDHAMAQADAQLRHLAEQTALRRDSLGLQAATGLPRLMPRSVEPDGTLRLVDMNDWCSGFYPGMLWQMYRYTHDDYWRQQADANTWLLEDVKHHDSSHDVGFMMGSSFGQAYQLTGRQDYLDVLVQSARTLATRFSPTVGCIRSWSWGGDRWQFPVIIDNMMNLELLFEVTRLTGDSTFHRIAVSHANQTLRHHFRNDGSCYHVVDYDPADGHVIKRQTFQGYADESVWSRGQAWALYGFTLCYRYTHDAAYLSQAQRVARFFFSQPGLPADLVPYWDMRDPAIPHSPRDASAAAIMASALYELATYVGPADADGYLHTADRILKSLTSAYQCAPLTHQGFLLLHSTGNHPAHDEIDVPINYADYYYLEVLNRSGR